MVTAKSSRRWWRIHRWPYNFALIIAGLLGFISFNVLGLILPIDDPEFEVTIFTIFTMILFGGPLYLLLMLVANLCYFLGPVSEAIVRPSNPRVYRVVCYRCGLWVSVLLPLSLSILLIVEAIFGSGFKAIE